MRIAVDAMGGDNAPHAIVQGSVNGARELGIEVVLVGQAAVIKRELEQCDTHGLAVEIADAPDVIHFDEQPALAVKARKGLSMRVMCDLVAQGTAAACLTMGHTGAGMVAGLLTFGRIEGIARPAVGVWMMGLQPDTFLIDIGANVECKPEYLLHFAIMGSVYMERVRGIPHPRVALLANGAEDNKGNAVSQAAFPLLKASGLNFIGNVEGLDIPTGKANVVVTDGYTGNVVLKYTEALAEHVLNMTEAEMVSEVRERALPALAIMREKSNYAKTGAVPLLGVNGLILIGHGRSDALAVKSGLAQAVRAVEVHLIEAIRQGVQSAGLIAS